MRETRFDDLPTSLPRVLYREAKFVCNLEPGDAWDTFGDAIIIVNPEKRPRVITFVDGERKVAEL